MAEATVKIADEFKILKKKWKHFYLKENPPLENCLPRWIDSHQIVLVKINPRITSPIIIGSL